ncbi:hypothetical protein [Pseudorhizobium pelagicum]|uniref:Uncharacterized protein n=1 Tax=Pseudorhizobium pelagicum TaxID=1509405 RepID=A0A922NZV6_9HYPH|nr:hypothetical protein [Pseudorhizobium pelagicum]KEQ04520.1 hypothetical protein GV67_08485 [Pseudorhizobium pelagicum]KEQ06680.1 hypothetical protein GV68_06460 [Pseudorhizobium pelagicum]
MLLRKLHENQEALKQIGREALVDSRRLGLPISAMDLENEAKANTMDRAAREKEERAPAALRQ